MKRFILLSLVFAFTAITTLGCSAAGPRKYLLFGEHVAEKVELFEDYWQDYPFKPDDPELPLRRGKGGVIRFFKKDNYTRSIMVDGDLTVNVYDSVEEGVSLTQPDSQLVISSKDLNEKYRKFDKEVGYTYHIYLDLGEYDQPEKEITILSVFKDAKTGQATLSKEIRTTAMGSTPLKQDDEDSELESEAKRWARKYVGEGSANPIAELQEKYSVRNQAKRDAENAAANTRLKGTIELDDSQFQDIQDAPNVKSASYLEQAQERHDALVERALAESREKNEYYRNLRRQQLEEFNERRAAKTDPVASLRDSRERTSALNFSDSSKAYVDFQAAASDRFRDTADRIGETAIKEYGKGPSESVKYESKRTPSNEVERFGGREKTSVVPDDFEPVRRQSVVDMDALHPSEMDKLDDFQPQSGAPVTEIYKQRNF